MNDDMEKRVFTSTQQVLAHYMPNYAAQNTCSQENAQAGPSVEGKGKEFAEDIFNGMKKDLNQPVSRPKKTLGKKLTHVLGSLFNNN